MIRKRYSQLETEPSWPDWYKGFLAEYCYTKNKNTTMNWISVKERLPDVEPASSFGEYYESKLMVVAYHTSPLYRSEIHYELAKFTKGRESAEDDFWEDWYVPEADDTIENVVAWMEFEPYK